MKYLSFVFLFSITISVCFGQKKIISGTLRDKSGKPVENANLIIYESNTDNISGYTISNSKGFYQLSFDSKLDSLRLDITCVNFSKITKFIKGSTNLKQDFVLTASYNQLSEVIVKPDPIELKGDTINYNPKSFSDKSDRFIIDIIKKLPGIKVTESGQILFNNKPINKFYIEGKDLLEDRYSIASNNLPSDAVEQIQVLQNHQPIRMLNGLEQSDRAALNIKLNKDAKLRIIGAGHIGAGLTPLLNDDNLTILKFSKNLQFINSVKYNNIGLDLNQEIGDQNISSNLVESGGFKKDLISLVKANLPQIDQSRYWFNNNVLVNNNYLISISKLFDLKLNAAYEHDNVTDYANALTQVFLPHDTIDIREDHIGSRQYSKFVSGLILQANTEKIYFKNSLKFSRLWSDATDLITPSGINQQLNNPFINLINDLSGSIKLNNNILGVNSFSSYSNLPQSLVVAPGQFSDVLNAGHPYSSLTQRIQLNGLFSDNSVTYSKKFKEIYLTSKLGVIVQHQTLANDISLKNGDVVTSASGQFQNNTTRDRFRSYNELNGSYSFEQFTFSAGLKSNINILTSNSLNNRQEANKIFLNPNISIAYKLGSYWETNLTSFSSNNISFDGNSSYVLQDYRSLIKNDVPLRQNKTKNISYSLNYKNVIDAVYANFKASFYQTISNVIVKTVFDGILATKTPLQQDNPYNNFTTDFNINKYFLDIKTAIDFSIEYNRIGSQEIQQDILTELKSNLYVLSAKLNTRLNKNISIEYTGDWSAYKNMSITANSKTSYKPINNVNQTLILKYFLPKEFQTRMNVENYLNTSATNDAYNYTFIDLLLQKNWLKPKVDFSFTISNILNTKNYSSYTYDTNTLYYSSYKLRGRMVMVRVGYQF